eukprot:890301-Rhodomonas_salina.7
MSAPGHDIAAAHLHPRTGRYVYHGSLAPGIAWYARCFGCGNYQGARATVDSGGRVLVCPAKHTPGLSAARDIDKPIDRMVTFSKAREVADSKAQKVAGSKGRKGGYPLLHGKHSVQASRGHSWLATPPA